MQTKQQIVAEEIVDLNKKKISIQTKIEKIEEKKTALEESSSKPASQQPPGSADVAITSSCNLEKRCLEIEVACSKPGWCVRSVMLFSDGVFP